ncbi:hypothetical protein HZH66_008264 [Vespula vulgaris]|uniref:Uncharacterized protein n=1 Tax=Vespula vulgaris TaxID=7454 RepID=A0A834N450_VESVU|nr:hypothetical protein HZH66_008264 [Vespula vulgaris]
MHRKTYELFVSFLILGHSLGMPMDYEEYPILDKDMALVGSFKRELRQSVPLKFHSEVEDLAKAGNTPKKDSKKIVKNASVALAQSARASIPIKTSFLSEPETNLVDIEETRSNLILRSREMSHALVDVSLETNKIRDDIDVGKSDEGGYYKTYGSDAEGEKGYLKETYSKGDHGYKTLDTFHKQDGDKYGFEKHFAYGKARLTDESDKHAEQSSKIGKQEDHEGAGTIVDSHYMDNEGDHGGEHTGDYGSHYMAAEPDSESYSDTGDGHSKNYSAGSEGSYESHSSYSSDSDSGGDYGEHY